MNQNTSFVPTSVSNERDISYYRFGIHGHIVMNQSVLIFLKQLLPGCITLKDTLDDANARYLNAQADALIAQISD